MSTYLHVRCKGLLAILICGFIGTAGIKLLVNAARISNSSSQCADLLMLFARGSSSNPGGLNLDIPFDDAFENGIVDPSNPGKKIGAEEVPGSFFRWMEKRIKADYPHVDYKAISVHYSGKGYSRNGYPAVGIFNFGTLGNALQAEFSWWKAGEYTDSVKSGSEELAGYVHDAAFNCPSQRIVVGGYSQGAQVVHEALKIIPENERNLIDNAVLFGDPKFIGADYTKYNLLDKPKAYPWHRGTAGLRERGLADAQIPYVPQDMWYKTISWCHEDDFVCTGLSGLSWSVTNHEMPGNDHSIWRGIEGAMGDGHTRYPVFGVPESTAEVMENLRTQLTAIEKSRGGLDPKVNPYQKVYDSGLVNDRPVDLMFALNYTGGNEDSQFQYFQKLKDVTKQYKKNFTQMNTGGLLYTDLAGNVNIANNSYVAGYARQANQLSSNMDDAFKGNVFFSGGLGGGGDYPENHGMLIERGGMFANWRTNATKHLVLFAERPAHETYAYNICNSTVVNSLPHAGETPCVGGNQFVTKDRPEWCASAIEVISADTCQFGPTTQSSKTVNRSLSDAVLLARAKGFVVDIIQPHTARNTQPAPYTPQYVENQLKNLAESTGGLYLKYSTFDEPALRDAVWQILNHQPKLLSVTQYSPGVLLDFSSTKLETIPLLGAVKFPADRKILLTASAVSGAQSYGWDFDSNGTIDDTSDGPSTEHVFSSGQKGIVSVSAFTSPNTAGMIATKAIPYSTASSSMQSYEQGTIEGLSELNAEHIQGDATTRISWAVPEGSSDLGLVILRDPTTGIPLISTQAEKGYVDTVSLLASYSVQYVDYGNEAEPQQVDTVVVVPVSEPDITDTTDIQDPVDPQPNGEENETQDTSDSSDTVVINDDEQDPPELQDTTDPQDTSGSNNGEENPPLIVEDKPIQTDPIEVVDEPEDTPNEVVEQPETQVPNQEIPEEEGNIIVEDPPRSASMKVEEIPNPPITEVLGDKTTQPTNTDVVGQDQNKVVTQKEPQNSNNNPKSQDQDTPNVSNGNTQTRNEPINAVLAAEDVKTNPQSEVGGIDAVNELFKGEGVGQQVEPEPEKSKNWPLIIGLGTIPLICLLLALVLFKKKNADES